MKSSLPRWGAFISGFVGRAEIRAPLKTPAWANVWKVLRFYCPASIISISFCGFLFCFLFFNQSYDLHDPSDWSFIIFIAGKLKLSFQLRTRAKAFATLGTPEVRIASFHTQQNGIKQLANRRRRTTLHQVTSLQPAQTIGDRML